MRRATALALVPLALATSLVAACQPTEANAGPQHASGTAEHRAPETEHRERVEKAWRDYEAALLDGDAARAVAMYSEDVTIRGSSGTLQGRPPYRDRVERFLSTTSLEYLKGEVEDVIVMGDHVFVAGSWSERFRRDASDEVVSLRGTYAWLWRLEDGGWRISQYIWNVHPDTDS